MKLYISFTPASEKAAPGAAVGGKLTDGNDNPTTGHGVIWRPYVNGMLKNFQQMSELCVSAVLNDLQSSPVYTVTFKPEIGPVDFRLTCDSVDAGFAQHDWIVNAEVPQGETDWQQVVKETNDLVKENNEMLKALSGVERDSS